MLIIPLITFAELMAFVITYVDAARREKWIAMNTAGIAIGVTRRSRITSALITTSYVGLSELSS
jgi:hypothetical protein